MAEAKQIVECHAASHGTDTTSLPSGPPRPDAARLHDHGDCRLCDELALYLRAVEGEKERLLDSLVAAREWMDTVIHGGATFKHGATLVVGEYLLARMDATLMQAPAPPDTAAVWAQCIAIADSYIEAVTPAVDTGNMWRRSQAMAIAAALRAARAADPPA
jgi:hypothetical protein